jgi:hypothetical protein
VARSAAHGNEGAARQGPATAGHGLSAREIVGFLDADYKTEINELAKVLPWLVEG